MLANKKLNIALNINSMIYLTMVVALWRGYPKDLEQEETVFLSCRQLNKASMLINRLERVQDKIE